MADWSFLEQGTVDELSLVLAPAADGKRSAAVFEAFRETDCGKAVQFRLKEAKVLEDNTVHLISEPLRSPINEYKEKELAEWRRWRSLRRN